MKVMCQLNRLAAGTAFVALAALTGASVAQADGAPSKGRVVYEKPSNWSGLYFGAQAGWSWSDVGSEFVTAGGVPLGFNDSVNHDAGIVGGQIGIQHQFGQIVVGIEGSGVFTYNDDFANTSCPNPARTCGKQLDNILSVGPRIGFAMGKWMPYVTGGYASASVSHKSFDNGAGTNGLFFQNRFDGWYLGGGVDMALAAGWTVGLEYRHYDFGSDIVETHNAAGAPSGEFRNVDVTTDTLSLRVSWKLGRPDRVSPLK